MAISHSLQLYYFLIKLLVSLSKQYVFQWYWKIDGVVDVTGMVLQKTLNPMVGILCI
uniref:Bm1250 n=1 Tax=Brugia malayi TaxID=6279 RepID=A0A1I9GE49_BRUMA|nr:Bm1250 [Brugia malayi]